MAAYRHHIWQPAAFCNQDIASPVPMYLIRCVIYYSAMTYVCQHGMALPAVLERVERRVPIWQESSYETSKALGLRPGGYTAFDAG